MRKTDYQPVASYRAGKKHFWRRGEPLTPQDVALLKPVAQRALELGRSPTRGEVESRAEIRQRFRIWEDVLFAIGLPSLKDPQQVRLRDNKNRPQSEADNTRP